MKNKVTEFGFEYGAATVERVTDYKDGSVVVRIETNKEIMHIRVTKGGKICKPDVATAK